MIVTKSKSKLVTVLIHILIWLVFGLMFYTQPLSWNITVPVQLWIKNAIIFSLLVGAYYLNAFVLVPRFLLKNHTGFYLLIIVSIITLAVILNTYVDYWLNLHQLLDTAFHKMGPPRRPHGHRREWDFGMIGAMIGTVALVLGISTSITTIVKWQHDKQVNLEKEQERVSSELSFLKAQINPHFFFNTLNNIYALTLVNADTSRKAIHQLSRMMRYVLYDNQNNTTQVAQEIAFVIDYISLMQLRLTDKTKINFTSPPNLTDMPIAPMIFLPFVENAFKHGVSAVQPGFIDINIGQHGSIIDLHVVNSIFKEQSNNLEQGSGIGLNNTRRRLDLLYPGNYSLTINDDVDQAIYSVHLTINLS
jgi:hypothetical protein